jgi:DNA polymerase III epsilon subunit-like protein
MPPGSMIHLNGNLLCVVDCETTGLDPYEHEIMEICFLPVDSKLDVRKDIIPFDVQIKPENDIDPDAVKINKIDLMKIYQTGLDKYDAAELFVEWAEKLKLPPRKRISPLAHNWAFDQSFIKQWLGKKTYELYIDGRYRDTMVTGLYLNDVADNVNERYPFPKVNLSYMAATLKLDSDKSHRAMSDCLTTLQIYKELIRGKY